MLILEGERVVDRKVRSTEEFGSCKRGALTEERLARERERAKTLSINFPKPFEPCLLGTVSRQQND
jgi:hypothetical protein